MDYPVHFWMTSTLQGDFFMYFGTGLSPVAEVSIGPDDRSNPLGHLQWIRGMGWR